MCSLYGVTFSLNFQCVVNTLISSLFSDSENLRNLDIWSRRCVPSRFFKYNSSGSVYQGSSDDQCLDSCVSDEWKSRGVLRVCSLLGSETQAQTWLRSASQSVQGLPGGRRTATQASRHWLTTITQYQYPKLSQIQHNCVI